MQRLLRRLRHTREEAAPTDIASTVFNITELFEAILIHLSRNNLLRARQVCKTIRDTSHTSPALRNKLFCSSSVQFSTSSWAVEHRRKIVTVRKPSEIAEGQCTPQWCSWVTPHAYNPLLFETAPYEFPCDLYGRCQGRWNVRLKRPTLFQLVKEDSIYREMYFSQPPITYVELRLQIPRNNSGDDTWAPWAYRESKHTVWSGDGVTVGQVIDEIKAKKEEGYSYQGYELPHGVYVSPAEMRLMERYGTTKSPGQSRWTEHCNLQIIKEMMEEDQCLPNEAEKKKSSRRGLFTLFRRRERRRGV